MILDSGLWWQHMSSDVNAVVRNCWECRMNKNSPLVSGSQRSRDYDGPFRFLTIDYVGPQNPPTATGHLYLFTAVCNFSGWYWAIPTQDDTSETAARTLAERVIMDLAGIPVIISSDRGQAFVHSVVKDLAKTFGIEQSLGTSFHPESQSAVERPHREYKTLTRAFMRERRDWDTVAPIFQWSVRTSAKIYNAQYTPYEIITGMKPRMLLDSTLSTPAFVKQIPITDYVKKLVEHVQNVHKFVSQQHDIVRSHQRELQLREHGRGDFLRVGDYCLIARPASQQSRDKTKHHDHLYQIVEVLGREGDARAYVVADAATGKRSDLGFHNPVSADRLVPIEVLPLSVPDGETRTRVQIHGRNGTIVNQCVDGRVYLRWDDSPADARPTLVDLTQTNYRWLH